MNDCRLCKHYNLRSDYCCHPEHMIKNETFGMDVFPRDYLNPRGRCQRFEPDKKVWLEPLKLTPREQVSGWKRFLRRGRVTK